MNNDDLERQLRAQAGPREQGYVPVRLPASIDDAGQSRLSAFLRGAVLVPAVAAGLIAVALATSLFRGPETTNPGSGFATPRPTSSPSTAQVPCNAQDVQVDAEPWGGAAGSRGTMVTLSPVPGMRSRCDIALDVSARITDAAGSVLATGSSGPGARVATLELGRSYTVAVAWSNWCAADPDRPVTLALRPANMPSWIEVPSPVGSADPVPPCLGESQPTNLSVTQLQSEH
jgi:hypothetical protein